MRWRWLGCWVCLLAAGCDAPMAGRDAAVAPDGAAVDGAVMDGAVMDGAVDGAAVDGAVLDGGGEGEGEGEGEGVCRRAVLRVLVRGREVTLIDRGSVADDAVGSVAGGDFDGDGRADVVFMSGGVATLHGDALGAAQARALPAVRDEGGTLTAVDLEGDGDLDLVASWASGAVELLANPGDGAFAPPVPLPAAMVEQAGPLVGDVDGDGDADLVMFTAVAGRLAVRVARQTAPLRFVAGAVVEVGANLSPLGGALADVDGDGALDVVALYADLPADGEPRPARFMLHRGDGAGGFGAPVGVGESGVRGAARAVFVDVDGDGDLDAVQAGLDGPAVAWAGDGAFVGAFARSAGRGSRVVPGDFDADGALDVAIVAYATTVHRGDGAGGFTAVTTRLPDAGNTHVDAVAVGRAGATGDALVVLDRAEVPCEPLCVADDGCEEGVCALGGCAQCRFDGDCGFACQDGRCARCVSDEQCGEEACWRGDCRAYASPTAGWRTVVVGSHGRSLCAVRDADTALRCFGDTLDPPAVGAVLDVALARSEEPHGCAVRAEDGRLVCFGGVPALAGEPAGAFTRVTLGRNHGCAIAAADGTVHCWGGDDQGAADPRGGAFTAIAASDAFTCGLRVDGSVACWGCRVACGFGAVRPPPGRFSALAVGDRHVCAIGADDGALTCWGQDTYRQSQPPPGQFAAVALGRWTSCGATVDGEVRCWGSDELSFAGYTRGERFVSLAAVSEVYCGVTVEGRVACNVPPSAW